MRFVFCPGLLHVLLGFFLPALIFIFVGTSQATGWEERLRYDPFSVESYIEP